MQIAVNLSKYLVTTFVQPSSFLIHGRGGAKEDVSADDDEVEVDNETVAVDDFNFLCLEPL